MIEQGDGHPRRKPWSYGPFGAKSVGEGGLVSPIGAVANAIYNAIGVQITEALITAEKIMKAPETWDTLEINLQVQFVRIETIPGFENNDPYFRFIEEDSIPLYNLLSDDTLDTGFQCVVQ